MIYILICLSVINVSAQSPVQTILDQSTITVYYRFTQQAIAINTPIVLTDTTVLEIGNIYSFYYNRSSFLRDSIYSSRSNSINIDQVTSISSFSSFNLEIDRAIDNMRNGLILEQQSNPETTRIYKNRQTGIIVSIDGDMQEMFRVQENISPVEWAIFPDTMIILSYLCFKATAEFRGRQYTAWFTPDIPINEGPWKLCGLPGLILRLEDSEQLFMHEAIGLSVHAEKPIIINEGRYTDITNRELQRWNNNRRNTVRKMGLQNGTMLMMERRNEIRFHQRELTD